MFRTIRRKIMRLAVVSGAGAAANYFLDKDRGAERREQAKTKAASLMGRATPATDHQSHAVNGFEPTPAPAPVATTPVPTVTEILGTADTTVDVLVAEPGSIIIP